MQKYHTSKASARQAIVGAGYTELYDTGSCGDYAHGSRVYYKKPDAPLNRFGIPITGHGTISKIGRSQWAVSTF